MSECWGHEKIQVPVNIESQWLQWLQHSPNCEVFQSLHQLCNAVLIFGGPNWSELDFNNLQISYYALFSQMLNELCIDGDQVFLLYQRMRSFLFWGLNKNNDKTKLVRKIETLEEIA